MSAGTKKSKKLMGQTSEMPDFRQVKNCSLIKDRDNATLLVNEQLYEGIVQRTSALGEEERLP